MNNEYSPLENFLNVPMIDYYKNIQKNLWKKFQV